MAQDQTSLYNLALSAVGTRTSVSITTERSREAEICNRWYEPVRDQVLRAAPWASAKEVALLAVSAERDYTIDWAAGAPQPPWRFRYALPANYLRARFLDSFARFDLGQYAGAPSLFTDVEEPVLTYTIRQTNVGAWDVDLYMAVVMGLAGHIAMPLHGKPQRAAAAIDQANMSIIQARVNAANEQQVTYDSLPDWLIARGASVSLAPSQYIYQNGPLLAITGSST